MGTLLEVVDDVEGNARGCSAANQEDLVGVSARALGILCHHHSRTLFCDEAKPRYHPPPFPCPPSPPDDPCPKTRDSSWAAPPVSLFVFLFDQPELRAKFPKKARVMPPVARGELPVDLGGTNTDKWLKFRLGKRRAR